MIVLPVIILFGIFTTVYTVYVSLHIYPLIGTVSDRPEKYYWETEEEHEFAKIRGWVILV
jgi:hypothetical protein